MGDGMIGRAAAAVSHVLERVSHSARNYWIVMVWDLFAASVLLTVGGVEFSGSVVPAMALALVGFAAWGPLEYGLHRWILHGAFPLPARAHARHHGTPETLISTPVFIISFFAGLIFLGLSTIVSAGAAALFVGGLYGGYNYFAVIHHLQHHRERDLSRIPYFHRRWRLHHIHHSHASVNFGISTTIWDRLFGTFESGPQPPPRYFFSRTIKSYRTRLTRRPSATSWE